MEQPRIDRVIQVMKYMSKPRTVAEIAQKMNTTYRSVYRYIETFKEAGIVVIQEGKTYCLSKASKPYKDFSQLLSFTDEEAYIINAAIDSIDDTNVLKHNLRKKLVSLYDCIDMPVLVTKGKTTSIVNSLNKAVKEKKQVVLQGYSSSHSKEKRDRHVEPFAFTANFQDVWAYDTEDGQNKLFKVSRITSVAISKNEWQNEGQHKEGYIDIFRFAGYDQLPIKLRLGVVSHNLILEEYPFSEQYMSKINKRYWLLETNLCSYVGACRFYMGLADDITIVDSPEFKAYVTNYITQNLV